ncbi:MAG: alpha/beta hydrolase [Candidatus Binatia bacterium]
MSGVLRQPHGLFSSAVILCHGMESNKESEKIVALAEILSENGLLTLRFDFACANESSGDFADITYSGEVEDLRAAFDYILQYPVRNIGVFGSSMGGTVALLFAGQEEKVAALATLAAPLHPEKITEQILSPDGIDEWQRCGYVIYHERRINVTLLEDLRTLNVPRTATYLRCPTLVIHGDRDETVPVEEGYELFSLLPATKKLSIIQGADHRFSDPDRLQQVLDLASGWMTGHLK